MCGPGRPPAWRRATTLAERLDLAALLPALQERALSGEPAPPPKEPSRKKGAGLSIVGGLGLLAGGLAVALVPGAREACLGWAQDRWEDVAPMPAEERHVSTA